MVGVLPSSIDPLTQFQIHELKEEFLLPPQTFLAHQSNKTSLIERRMFGGRYSGQKNHANGVFNHHLIKERA